MYLESAGTQHGFLPTVLLYEKTFHKACNGTFDPEGLSLQTEAAYWGLERSVLISIKRSAYISHSSYKLTFIKLHIA